MTQRDPDFTPPFDIPLPYTARDVSQRHPAPPSSSMPNLPPDRPNLEPLKSQVQEATLLRLQLRNVDPATNKDLPPNNPAFIPPNSELWRQKEETLYDRLNHIYPLLPSPTVAAASLPLEVLFPLSALLRLALDNQHLATHTPLPDTSSYYLPRHTKPWNRQNQYWHLLSDRIGLQINPKLQYWLSAPWVSAVAFKAFSIELGSDDLAEARQNLSQYLSLSLSGKLTPKGKDSVFNPYYQQAHGKQASVRAWLGQRISGAVLTVAKKQAQQRQRSEPVQLDSDTGEPIDPVENLQAPQSTQWWKHIQEIVEQFSQELENIKPRTKELHHINAKLVILNRLPPPQDWSILAQQWGCDRTTLERFYKNQCVPWLRQHISKEDLF